MGCSQSPVGAPRGRHRAPGAREQRAAAQDSRGRTETGTLSTAPPEGAQQRDCSPQGADDAGPARLPRTAEGRCARMRPHLNRTAQLCAHASRWERPGTSLTKGCTQATAEGSRAIDSVPGTG
eukprot:6090596-Alexandrium_andersonii.AAC.1